MLTAVLRTACALRIRVSMSEMGSVMLMRGLLLPARLDHAGDFPAHGDLAQLVTPQPELAVHATRPPGQRAAVTKPHRARIPRQLLQLGACLGALFVRAPRVVDRFNELRTTSGELRHGLAAFVIAIDKGKLGHN